jgi:acetyl-CoA acetyltransferase
VIRLPADRRPVIAGLGLTEIGPVYGRTAPDFAAEAVRLAVADAGLSLQDVDGLLTSNGTSGGVGLGLQRDLGLFDLRLLSEMQGFGSTAASMVQFAAMAVASGMAEVVACVFADAPLRPGRTAGEVYGNRRRPASGGDRATAMRPPTGWGGLLAATGVVGANTMYALAARRHMLRYGTTTEDFGAVAVAQRSWAVDNPHAQLRQPITLDDHRQSRWIADPFRKLDCCLVSNGGVCVVVTNEARATGLAQPPVHVLGWAQCHPGHLFDRDPEFGLVTGAARSGPAALAMAGVTVDDVQVAELYDCYTFTVLLSLEDYGFCRKGEGGPFVSSGAIGPQGKLKLNTGGGQLSSYYMWGMTPLSEAVIQVRGQGGARQVRPHDLALVSGNGGVLDHHATLVLGSGPT